MIDFGCERKSLENWRIFMFIKSVFNLTTLTFEKNSVANKKVIAKLYDD